MEDQSIKKRGFLGRFWWLIILIVITIGLGGWYIMKKSVKPVPPILHTNIPGVEIVNFDNLYETRQGFISQKQSYTIQTEKDLEDLWSTIMPAGSNDPLPKVDFSTDVVAVVALGENDSSCSTMSINKVFRFADKDLIQYTVNKPGENCACTMEIRRLVSIIKFSKSGKPIDFEGRMETKSCSN